MHVFSQSDRRNRLNVSFPGQVGSGWPRDLINHLQLRYFFVLEKTAPEGLITIHGGRTLVSKKMKLEMNLHSHGKVLTTETGIVMLGKFVKVAVSYSTVSSIE